MHSVLLGKRNPSDKLFKPEERLSRSCKRILRATECSSNPCMVNTLGKRVCDLNTCFQGFSKGNLEENLLQNLSGMSYFSSKNSKDN